LAVERRNQFALNEVEEQVAALFQTATADGDAGWRQVVETVGILYGHQYRLGNLTLGHQLAGGDLDRTQKRLAVEDDRERVAPRELGPVEGRGKRDLNATGLFENRRPDCEGLVPALGESGGHQRGRLGEGPQWPEREDTAG